MTFKKLLCDWGNYLKAEIYPLEFVSLGLFRNEHAFLMIIGALGAVFSFRFEYHYHRIEHKKSLSAAYLEILLAEVR